MNPAPFIDIHTHQLPEKPLGIHVLNQSKDFGNLSAAQLYSTGLHPWYLNPETAETEFALLEIACQNPNVVAIGECGLDNVCKTEFNLQTEYFKRQIALANRIQKPLIIHVVRAFEELQKILREENCAVPVIIHGFQKDLSLALRLLACGYHLSFGKHLLTNEKVRNDFLQLPVDSLLLETDASGLSIQSIYEAAAEIRKMDLPLLREQIHQNTQRLFGHILHPIHE